jgi:hypothetical protein
LEYNNYNKSTISLHQQLWLIFLVIGKGGAKDEDLEKSWIGITSSHIHIMSILGYELSQ